MADRKEDKRARFLKIYANVPEDLREDIVAVVDAKSYTWNIAYLEIKDNTELGKKILNTLINMNLI